MKKKETVKIHDDEDPWIAAYLPILQSIKAHLHLIDGNLRIQWANATGLKGGGRELADITGKHCYEVHLGRTAPCKDCPVKRVFDSHKPHMLERWVPLPDGSERCFEVRVYPVSDKRGIPVYAIKIGFDVTRRRLAGQKTSQYVETLETSLRELIQDPVPPLEHHNKDDRFGLSKREIQVLRLMSQGFSNIEISRDLAISPHTVKTHVTHIFDKIGVTDRTQAAVLAARLGII
ncbi:MAG: PAS domain-containing protein [Desulfomonile tiedjei]|nr:PAS domain-containing protein [Desulfomonile tiedjei]